jgi:adenylate cyclase class IV
MSFDIKYDRDGAVIPQPEPQFEEQPAEVPTESAPEVVEDSPEPVQEQPAPVQKPAPQESWKILREKAERAERRAAELEQALLATQKESESQDEDFDVRVDDDSLVEGKHLSKVSKKIQHLEKQLRQYEQQSTVSATEVKLKQKYPDFDAIVSVENLENLRSSYPEIAHTIDSSNDLYSKAVTAYTMIKRLGISPQDDPFKHEKELAQRNAAKPKSLASISPQQGDSPLSKANAFANGTLTEDMKQQLWKEMNQYRK